MAVVYTAMEDHICMHNEEVKESIESQASFRLTVYPWS